METIFFNARIVTRQEVVSGSLQVGGTLIRTVDSTGSRLPGALDMDGDYLLPGLIEVHTDNLEKQMIPRPGGTLAPRPGGTHRP